MPFVNQMYQKYAPYGLVLLGIHSPEFAYEGDINQVKAAIGQYGIKYPVLIDNQRVTWNEFGDSYWPKDVLIGKDGYIAYSHIGTGDDYNREEAIRVALSMR